MFLSANNFFWRVEREGDVLVKSSRWRDLGRPEAALVGVQYVGHQRSPRGSWVVRRTPARSWIFAGTDLHVGSRVRSRRCRDRPSHGCVAARRPSRGRDPAPLRPRHESPDDVLRDGTRGAGVRRWRVPPHPGCDVRSGRVARARKPLGAAGEDGDATRIAVAGALAVALLAIAGRKHDSAVPPALVCKLPRDSIEKLPPNARHGLIDHLLQYPAVSLATPKPASAGGAGPPPARGIC